jgi:TetR/AcrR family transcriptional regulator
LASNAQDQDRDVEIVRIRRRQPRAALTRQKILDAAAAEFASAGFDGATTRSIAARAEVPHGLVIYHFETKFRVWHAVIENALNYFHSEFAARMAELEGCDDVTRLRECHRIFIRVSAKRPELNWVLSRNFDVDSVSMTKSVETIIGSDIDLTIDLIRKVQSRHQYVEGDPAHLHYLFVGAASRIFALSRELDRIDQSPFDDAFLERHIELCRRLFFRDPPNTKPRTMKIVIHHAEMTVSAADHSDESDSDAHR